jgi:hypothetical protein
MQKKLIAVEAYAPDDMDDTEVAREVARVLEAALAAGDMRVEAGHVRTLL